MMKKMLSMLLTLVMVVGFGSVTFTGAAAATGDSGNQGYLPPWAHSKGGFLKEAQLLWQSGQTAAKDPKENEVIVQFADPDSSDVDKAEAAKLESIEAMAEGSGAAKGKSEIEIANGITVQKDEVWEFDGQGGEDSLIVAVASSNSMSAENMMRKLQHQDMVERVTPNSKRRICADHDPYRDYQWALNDYPGITVDQEWDGSGDVPGCTGSADNIVAVIDTGVDYNHPDLKSQMWVKPESYGNKLIGKYGFDFVNSDSDPMDDNGHGSHCAGIIGAATNGAGVQGVNQNVKVMALKVLDNMGSGYDSDILAAFNYVYKSMRLGTKVVAINCSFGGEEPDEILDEVIDKIGKFEKKDKNGKVIQRGAITVCAAGNEGVNCDDVPSYPACCDSEYVIAVAATKNVPPDSEHADARAEIVSFSNYGEDNVDIAAPGTDILSSVSYPCFNPTLYKKNDGTIDETILDEDQYVDGREGSFDKFTHTNLDAGDIVYSNAAGFCSDECLEVRFHHPDGNNKQMQYAAIPYSLPDNPEDLKSGAEMSMMIRTFDGPKTLSDSDYFGGTFSKVLLLDVPLSALEDGSLLKKSGEEILTNYICDSQIVSGDNDYWKHLRSSTFTDVASEADETEYYFNSAEGAVRIDPYNNIKKQLENVEKDRALLILGDSQAGGFKADIDDVGVSRTGVSPDKFGKYDFYSGTSMATPCVTGAAALLKAANLGNDYGPEMLIGDIMSMANDTNKLTKGGKKLVNTEGSIDFAKKGTGLWVGIGSVTVDTAKNQIKLKGRFNNGDVDLSVKKLFSQESELIPESQFISRTDKEIILKADGLINNVMDITVSKDTKSSTKKDVYIVKGKKEYSVIGEGAGEIPPNAVMTTDGRKIYAAMSMGDCIIYMNPNDKYFETGDIINITKGMVKKFFPSAKNTEKTAQYDFRFGDDLVKIGKYFYVRADFCQVAGSAFGDDDDWSKDIERHITSGESDNGGKFEDTAGSAYSVEETYILKINGSTGKIEKKLPWPKGADQLLDSKLASYNGTLYLLGGMNEYKNSFSNKVYSYNTSKNSWTAKPNLPQGRAGGKVLQTGNTLVYTLGYTADNAASAQAPANYIFNGSKWTKKSSRLEPVDPDWTTVSRDGKKYFNITGSVGICKDGLVYIGVPVKDYGDTFTYSVSKDKYSGTNFNYTKDLYDLYDLYSESKQIGGLAVGASIFCTNEDEDLIGIKPTKKAKGAISSGLAAVTPKTVKNAKVSGAGNYMPGASCTFKVTANPGYYVSSLKLAGKTGKNMAKGMTVTATVTKNVNAAVKTGKVTVKSVKSLSLAAGKTGSLKAGIKQKAAAKQWKLAYKSSNKKYATVNSGGKVKAKAAGKGKTVKIKIMLKGTSKTMKTVKVTIK